MSLRDHDDGLQGTDKRQRVSKQNFWIWNKKTNCTEDCY